MATTEQIAVVDLRVLSQSDISALASSSSSYCFHPTPTPTTTSSSNSSDDWAPPKIDRAIFNESEGSRKQTFSRLRLAPSNPTNTATTATGPHQSSSGGGSNEDDTDHRIIAYHLRRLFARDDPSFNLPPETLTLENNTPEPPDQPPKPDNSMALVAVGDPDKEILNQSGNEVDLVKLGELVDPFGEELRNRTAGLKTEAELLGFMNGIDGQWGSRRRRRKFVDSVVFGEHLPRGWKLLLGLKRKEGIAWINCRRFVRFGLAKIFFRSL